MCLFSRLIYFSVLVITTLSQRTDANCSDQPRLFFHQRTSIRELGVTESFVTLNDVSREFLTCRASQNVEWVYEGNGEPSKLQESSSIQIKTEVQDGSLEYCITSRVSIYPKQSDTDLAKHTGRYICQEIGNSSNTASIHVYVGRRNAPAFLQSRRTITLTLSQENVTDSSFLIPCATSTPFVNATLFHKPSHGFHNSKFKLVPTSTSGSSFPNNGSTDLSNNGESSLQAIFDPKYGFRVGVNWSSEQNLSSFYGDYKCVGKIASGPIAKSSNENGDEDFVIYSLITTPTFRVFPQDQNVFTSTILNFTCESEEPVILKEVKVRTGYDAYDELEDNEDANSNSVEDIEETVEKNENKVHVANYLEMNPVPGSFGEFQCLTEKDKRVLHSWQYRVLGKKEEKLSGIKFNKREGSFSCRSKSGIPGRLSFVSCRTPSECRINGICLQKSEGCRGYSNATKALCHRGNHFCGKIFYKGGSGLIRCIGDGIDQIRGFTDEANDLRLRMGFHKLKPSETAFLSFSRPSTEEEFPIESLELREGDEVNLSLKLGYYYFLQPVQWAIKFNNGSSMHIAPEKEELRKTKLHRTIHARLRLTTFPENSNSSISQIVGINVLIPLRSSEVPSWKTITLPVKVTTKGSSNFSSPSSYPTPENPSPMEDDEGERVLGQKIEGSERADIQFDAGVEETTLKIMENLDDTNNNSVIATSGSLLTEEVAVGELVTDPSTEENSQDYHIQTGDDVIDLTTERDINHS